MHYGIGHGGYIAAFKWLNLQLNHVIYWRLWEKIALLVTNESLCTPGIFMEDYCGKTCVVRITWPLDGDAGLVFRSAHFATFFTILSVKFEPLCIRPIMSTKADKGDRKREIEQSPMKKKFRDSAISSEDLDNAIANRIELAFKEHQSTLNSVVNSAVRDAMDSVLIPALRELREDIQATNKSVKELREEFEAIVTKTKQTRDRVDSVQAAAREDKRTVTNLKDQLERLTEKMTDMEDRSTRNNVRLVGLPEGMEGPDAAGFLRANLSKWIPSLRGPWHWDWSGASRVWRREGLRSAAHSHLPCTEMAWQIRYPERCSAGVSGEVRTEQCHTAVFSWL